MKQPDINQSTSKPESTYSMTIKHIVVAAAVISNSQQQLLVVRKKNTPFFMQVGGKLEPQEHPELALIREIKEEIGVDANIVHDLGRFDTAAANEPNHQLISYVYQVELSQQPQVQAEIAEMKWIDPLHLDASIPLAPLTKEVVIPWFLKQLG